MYLKTPNAPGQRAFLRCAASFFLEIRQYSCEKMSCATQKSLAAGHIMSFQIHPRNLRLPSNFFFCFSKRKSCKKKTNPGGFRFPPGAPLNRPEKPLRFFWESATNLQLPNGPMCTGKRQTHIRNAPSSRTAVTGIGPYGTPTNPHCPANFERRADLPQPFKGSCFQIRCTVTGGA